MTADGEPGRNGVRGVVRPAKKGDPVKKCHVRNAAVRVARGSADGDIRWRSEGLVVGGRGNGDGGWQVAHGCGGALVGDPAAPSSPISEFDINVDIFRDEMHNCVDPNCIGRIGVHAFGPGVPIGIT